MGSDPTREHNKVLTVINFSLIYLDL